MEQEGKRARLVADLMSAPAVTATADEPLVTAAARMSHRQVWSAWCRCAT
jgi:CBS domain-containing protein